MNKTVKIAAFVTLALLSVGAVTCLTPWLLFPHLGGEGINARYQLTEVLSQSELVHFYYGYAHTIFILLLLASTTYLVRQLYVHTTGPYLVIDKPGIGHALSRLRTGWPTLLLFLIYAVVMFDETSFYHGEIVGWYTGVYTRDLLDNFRLNQELISETMRRDDFRFFPLAHHDLHVLGWFTPYIKLWILISTLELFLIVYFAKRLVNSLTGKEVPYLLLAASLLFLLNSGTARAFFQLVFAERMVVVFFAIFAYSYLRYRQTLTEKYLYLCLLTASFGVFFKDIAIILFVGLAFVHAAAEIAKRYRVDFAGRTWQARWEVIRTDFRLELILSGLAVAWFVFYLFLSFFPSLVAGDGAYNQEKSHFRLNFEPSETRLHLVLAMLIIRPMLMLFRRAVWNLLDSLNVSAAVYALAIWTLVGWSPHSYMALPVYFVGLLNLLYLLTLLYAPLRLRAKTATPAIVVGAACIAGLLTFEATAGRNFVDVIQEYKTQQWAWRMTMKKAARALRHKHDLGETANLIYTESWFNERRHLDRLPFDRLIYLDPVDHYYLIKRGKGRGSLYQPQYGDLLINIDEDDLSFLGEELAHWHLLYTIDEALPYARIYQYR